MISGTKNSPWLGNLNHAQKIKSWLRLADFELENQTSILFRPPVKNERFYEKLNFLETVGSQIIPVVGGEYILIARAKVIPLTPIRLKWKQKLGEISISPTITGHVANQSRQNK